MRIKEDYSEEVAVAFNIISLIDIVFFLLIFFLAATTFAQVERDRSVRLPSSASPEPLSAAPSSLIINITENGTVRVGDQECSYQDLTDVLAAVAKNNAEKKEKNEAERDILIRADHRSRHAHFASVVELAYRVGIDKARIGYEVDASALKK
jgi:biopolymer transport protein ExbD